MKTCLLISFVLGTVALSKAEVPLEQYNVNPNTVTVSGLSAGGAMATQLHVALSSEISGVAIFAGLPYLCADGMLSSALMCMSSPGLTNVNNLIQDTDALAANNEIDDTVNMDSKKVFVFHGTLDTTVRPGNGDNIEIYYTNYNSIIRTEFTIEAEHGFPTDNYGPACDYNGGEYINNCGYNGAYESLNYIYGESLTRPNGSLPLNGQFLLFNQKEFFDLNRPGDVDMDDAGFLYVPSACVDKQLMCRLHIVLHGCLQGRQVLDDVYATKTGYLEVGELNNIIILFPQAIRDLIYNPNGCFDWWGYNTALYDTIYATKNGPQIDGIRKMVQRIIYAT